MLKKILCLLPLLFFTKLVFTQITQLDALPKYSWNIDDVPGDFNEKIQFSFVHPSHGFPGFGTVLTGGPTNVGSDGGAFQMYFPYNNANGGSAPKIRLGRHPTYGWSEWSSFYTSANANNFITNWKAKELQVDSDILNTVGSGGRLILFEEDQFRKNRIILGADENGAFLTSTFGSGGTDAISFRGSGNSKVMTLSKEENVGIGTEVPAHKLDVKVSGSTNFKTYDYGSEISVESNGGWARAMRIRNETKNSNVAYGAHNGDAYISTGFDINVGPVGHTFKKIIIKSNGEVGIGTNDPAGWKLAVNGKIRAKEIKVETDWSDFVFEEGYNLPSLQDVEKHIEINGHLQDIPSAKDVAENGIFLGEMDSKLLQKIEELMLYTIQQNKRIELLEKELEILKRIRN